MQKNQKNQKRHFWHFWAPKPIGLRQFLNLNFKFNLVRKSENPYEQSRKKTQDKWTNKQTDKRTKIGRVYYPTWDIYT